MKIIQFYRAWKPGIRDVMREIRYLPGLMRNRVSRAFLRALPPGDGRPVLVIPGFLCSDIATWPMRSFLKKIGYQAFGWGQGINWGPRPGVRTRLLHRINGISRKFSQPVTLIGWSLGGIYARELPCIRPDLVREVITLGSPVQGKPQALSLWKIFSWLNRRHMAKMSSTIMDYDRPILGRNLAIFTRSDGIVPWQNCVQVRGRLGKSIEVDGSHIGLIQNPNVMTALARHLSDRQVQ